MTTSGVVDLRSDTVTRPTAGDARRDGARRGRRRRLRRRPDASTRCRRASPRCSARRRRCSSPAARRATWSAIMTPLRPRRRVHRRPDGAHLPLGRRRRRGARQRPAAAARAPARRHAGAGRHRGGDQARRLALRAQPAALPGEHDRRQGAAAAPTSRRRRALARDARPGDASRRRAPVQRRGRSSASPRAREHRARRSTACRSASPRASARRSARRWSARRELIARGAPLAQDARRRHAPGRRARRGGAATRSSTTSSAWPRTMRYAQRLAEACRARPACTVEPPQTNMRVRRPGAGERARRPDGRTWRARGVLRDRPRTAALRHPPRRRCRAASTAPSRAMREYLALNRRGDRHADHATPTR